MAVALIARAVISPPRTSESWQQIGAYGFSGKAVDTGGEGGGGRRRALDDLANNLGEFIAKRIGPVREAELRQKLVRAGMYTTGPRKFVGYQLLLAIALPIVWIWFSGLVATNGAPGRLRSRACGADRLGGAAVVPEPQDPVPPGPDRLRAARADRPPGRLGRGRRRLQRLAADRGRAPDGPARPGAPPHDAGTEHGPLHDRGAEEPARARRHAGRPVVRALRSSRARRSASRSGRSCGTSPSR